MRPSAFDDEDPVLPASLFQFMLDLEIRRAVRSQTFLTFLMLSMDREWDGLTFRADEGAIRDMADIVGRTVRDTDVMGHAGEGTLAVALFQSGYETSTGVIDRIVASLASYQFPTTLRITIGAACYPMHGSDVLSLQREALARPVAVVPRDPHGPIQRD
jgi:GGDEF domain-containing protein